MNRLTAVGLVAGFAIFLVVGAAMAKGDPAKGKAVYDLNCAPCHGTSGKGDGPAAAALSPKPKDLVDSGFVNTLKDDFLKKLIKGGGQGVGKSPMMPPFGSALKENDVENVIAYLRALAKKG